MPKENTQPENNETNRTDTDAREADAARTEQPTDAANHTPPSSGGVVHGALNNALMRTFRSDAHAATNDDAYAPSAPRTTTPDAESAADAANTKQRQPQQQKAPRTKRNAAVVHTFKDDVQHLVRNRKMSLARMTALESDRGRPNAVAEEPGGWRMVVMVALGILFLVAAALIVGGAYYSYVLNTQPAEQVVDDPAFIFTETRERIDVTDMASFEIKRALADRRRSASYALGAVIDWHLTRTLGTFSRTAETQATPEHLDAEAFLTAIEASVSDTFVRTIDDYLLGIHTTDDGAVPFLIFTTSSHGYAFSGMFEWEQTIEDDLAPLFSPGATSVRSAISGGAAFEDISIENIDIRRITDENGQTRILYAFINRSTVIITTQTRTLLELANRVRVAEVQNGV